jgi:multisubunit Na+/H+ antiporter MnhG subunit
MVSRVAERHARGAIPESVPSRRLSPEGVAAVALVCLYLVVASGHLQSIDGLMMYRQGVSLAFHQSLHWSPPILWGDSRTTSSYGIGLSLLYLPGLIVFSWFQPHLPVPHGAYDFSLLYSDPLWPLAGMPVHILVVAAGAYLVARLVRALGFGTGPALWGLALFGLGSPAIVYARADTAQLVEGLCWIGAVYAALLFRRTHRDRWLWGCAIAIFFAILTRPLEGLLIAPAAAALVFPGLWPWPWTRAWWTAAAVLAGSLGAAIAVTLAVNVGRFGAPLTFGVPASWTTPLPIGLAGALVSPGRGMLWAFPAIVLVPLGLSRLWRGGYRWLAAVITALCLALLLNVSLWTWWWGGWSWGLRLFLPALPLLAVLAAAGIAALPAGARGWLPGLLLAAGVLWAAPGIVTDLLGGYAGTYDGTGPSFRLDAYPPIGAWTFLHHWRAQAPTDSATADILWLRLSRLTHNLSLVPPLLLAVAAGALMIPVRRLVTRS